MPVRLCAECIRVKEAKYWNLKYNSEADDITAKVIKLEKRESTLISNLNFNNENNNSNDNNNNNNNDNENDIDINTNNNNNEQISLNEYYLNLNNIEKNSKEFTMEEKEKEDTFIINYNKEVINPFGTKFSEVAKEIREHSPFKDFETYKV